MMTFATDKLTRWKKKDGCGEGLQQLVDVINDSNNIHLPTRLDASARRLIGCYMHLRLYLHCSIECWQDGSGAPSLHCNNQNRRRMV